MLNIKDKEEKNLLLYLGRMGLRSIGMNTSYLLTGKEPNKEMVAKALKDEIVIITESEFIDLLGS